MKNTDHTWDDIQGQRITLWDDNFPSEPQRYGQWYDRKDGRYLVPNYTSGSDYSGGLVTQSNYEVFQEEFKDGGDVWWTHAPGGHGTYAIIIDTVTAPQEALDFFLALEDYPLADEDHHSHLESEAEDEAWSNWVESDFVSALGKHFGCTFDTTGLDIYDLFRTLCERSNTYWEHETEGPWIDLERLIKYAKESDVKDWPRESC